MTALDKAVIASEAKQTSKETASSGIASALSPLAMTALDKAVIASVAKQSSTETASLGLLRRFRPSQ
jgi:hypothetical protein